MNQPHCTKYHTQLTIDETMQIEEPARESYTVNRALNRAKIDGPGWAAYYGMAVLSRAEDYINKNAHVRDSLVMGDYDAVSLMRSTRTDLRAVMEYMDGLDTIGGGE